MSPAYSQDPEQVFSWVGIIMYLPTQDEAQRDRITAAFKAYEGLCRRELWGPFEAAQHWAKIELVPDENGAGDEIEDGRGHREEGGGEGGAAEDASKGADWETLAARSSVTSAQDRAEALAVVRARFSDSLARFEELRGRRDPQGVLLNDHMDALLGTVRK